MVKQSYFFQCFSCKKTYRISRSDWLVIYSFIEVYHKEFPSTSHFMDENFKCCKYPDYHLFGSDELKDRNLKIENFNFSMISNKNSLLDRLVALEL